MWMETLPIWARFSATTTQQYRTGSRTAEQVTPTQSVKKQLSLADAFQQAYPTSSEKHKKITNAGGTFIAKDLQPFFVVRDVGFRHLMKMLYLCYAVLYCTFFSSQVIPNLYETTRKGIDDELAKTRSLALTTSSATESYLTVTVHYVTTDNASNIVNVIHVADGLWPQRGCFAHIVNIGKKAASVNLVSLFKSFF